MLGGRRTTLTPKPSTCWQDLAHVNTPPNVRMISTSQAELAWLLAGIVYPANADESLEVYPSDFSKAATHFSDMVGEPVDARSIAAKFIDVLLSKVRKASYL